MPFASAVDSPLVGPEELVYSILSELSCRQVLILVQVVVKETSKPDHVRLPEGQKIVYRNYGPLSVEEWHKQHGLWVE